MLTKKEAPKSEAKSKATRTAAPVQVAKNLNDAKASGPSPEKKIQQKTKIIVKFDVGFQNQLYIRGKGANLSWEKGQPLKNTRADEWVWETDSALAEIEFKVLINDRTYESGENHSIRKGSSVIYTPRF